MMDEFTSEFIQQQREIAERATPRPWDKMHEFNISGAGGDRSVAACGGYSHYPYQDQAYNENIANAEYIVTAANNYPDALVEIERLREAQRWIPVSERLPEAGDGVLVYYGEDEAYGFEHGMKSKLGSFFSEHVTHWMPLPEPPKEA